MNMPKIVFNSNDDKCVGEWADKNEGQFKMEIYLKLAIFYEEKDII